GAKLACLTFLNLAAEALGRGLPVQDISIRQLHGWHEQLRGRLSLEGCLRGLELRDFACTLLTAVVSKDAAVFSQIGDGAIVLAEADGYQPVFWPQMGEYASTTFFLTAPDFAERMAFRIIESTVDELSLFTDGLQSLALHYASRNAHAPFFAPLFEGLRKA